MTDNHGAGINHDAEVAAALARVLSGALDFLIVEPMDGPLSRSPSDETLTLPLRAEVPGYIQFTRTAPTELYSEAAGSKHLPPERPLTEVQESRLRALGWQQPSRKSGGNWYRVVAAENLDVNAEARLALATLREVYGAKVDPALAQRRADLLSAGLSEQRADAISSLPAGPYSLLITGAAAQVDTSSLDGELRRLGFDEPDLVLERAVHIRPEVVAPGVSERAAIELKKQLEAAGARVRIEEEAVPTGLRASIPRHVQREVWRRDQGRCVVCGTQERLEFDHIIPVSKGGANTVRNIELRCEHHNRSKGATI
jgi:hypothetical protein